MIEIEAKVKVSHEKFLEIYRRFGNPKFLFQKNWGYSYSGNIIRVREEGNRIYVTLKKVNNGKKYSSREEIEFNINDINSFRHFLDSIGIKSDNYYEKQRATITFMNSTICFDRISPNMEFIEVEGDEKSIEIILHDLGISEYPIERRNYFEIIAEEKVV